MNYTFVSIDNYQILVHNRHGFMTLEDAIKLLNDKPNEIKNDLDARSNNEENQDIKCISYLDKTYYSLDVILLAAFYYNYKSAFKLYESALKKQILFTNFVDKTMSEEKVSLKKLTHIINDSKNLIRSFYKLGNAGQENNNYGNPGCITIESLQMLIQLIKDNYNFPDDFGKINDFSTLLDILYYTNSTFFEKEPSEIEFGNDDDICYATKTMYNIIKKKPFASGNEIIASFITYYYLDQSNLIENDDEKITTCEDISLACGLIINSNDNNAVDTLKKVKSLLAKHYSLSNSNSVNQLSDIIDTSKEGIINYIISAIENFSGYQGYYDYYRGKSCVYKIHYHGKYNHIFLNKAKTFLSNNTLFFKGTLHCFTEAPNDLLDRETFLKNIIEEINARSYHDIIIPFLNKLKDKVKPHFNLDSISIKFDFEIKTKVEDDSD